MNVLQLITSAYYLSNIVSRGLETVSGPQFEDGLELLNDIMGEKGSDGSQLVYYDRTVFPGVVSQELYFIENLVSISTLTVNLQDVRYSMTPINRHQYFGSGRINRIDSFPYQYYTERAFGVDGTPGMNIFVYFEPSQTSYIFELVGKYGFPELQFNDVISNKLERFYISYLKYELANRICHFNGQELEPSKQQKLIALARRVTQVNGFDSSVNIVNQFESENGLNWGDITWGHGWRP